MESEKKETKTEVENVSKEIESKIQISKDTEEEDPFVTKKAEVKDDSEAVVKSKTGEEVGLENLVTENDLISKDLTWEEMGVRKEIIEGLLEMNFQKPSKIQTTTFPLIMREPFSHLVAQAKNGAGKTGAFGLGVISRVDEKDQSIQAVVFGHTRELVNQIESVLGKIAKNTQIKVTSLHTTDKNKELGQVVVITPGHFDTMFLKKKQYKLDKLKLLVLDEADYMLTNEVTQKVVDKTFKFFHDNKYKVQILFFSATFTDENFKAIKKYYKKAHMIEIKKEELTLTNVKQVYYNAPNKEDKITFVADYLKKQWQQERVIIFLNSRDFTLKLRDKLASQGYKVFILMGGDMDPKNRDETIKKFNQGEIQILLTTNVLARGFDEKLVQLVINYDIPVKKEGDKYMSDPETYLHRIGRTGRFGAKGIGLSLVSGERDLKYLKEIEDYYKSKIDEIKSLDELEKERKEFFYKNY